MRLGQAGLEVIQQEVLRLDPNGSFVSLDVDAKRVRYAAEIVQHELIGSYEGEEEPVRAYIVAWLCTEGGYLPTSLELEKRYSIGRGQSAGAELDILVNHPDGTPFALIETKAPEVYDAELEKYLKGQLFALAPHEAGSQYIAFATARLVGGQPQIVTTTIDVGRWPTYDGWVGERHAAAYLPANYGEAVHEPLTRGGTRDLRTALSLAEINRLRRRLHDTLWKGSTPDNTVYDYVVRLFLAKIYDEKNTQPGNEYRFQIKFVGGNREIPATTFDRVNDLYRDAYNRYLNIDGTADPEQLNPRQFSFNQLAFVVQLLEDVSLTSSADSGTDVLGAFFEGITREGFKQSKGLFFTHKNIVEFMLSVIDVEAMTVDKIASSSIYSDRLPYIIDPSCGSATFLIGAMQQITLRVSKGRKVLGTTQDIKEFIDTHFPKGHENLWAKDFIYGIEDNELLATASKVNMVLRRDGNAHIFKGDGLSALEVYSDARLRGSQRRDNPTYSKAESRSFDIVVSNPPFSIELDPVTKSNLNRSFELAGDPNSENLFLERWYQLLRPGGRLGVVLPESFFSTKENIAARVFLFKHFDVRAVVALPKHAFEPWTPTRTALLFAKRKSLAEDVAWCAAFNQALAEATRTLAELKSEASKLGRAVRRLGDDANGVIAELTAALVKVLGSEPPTFCTLQEVREKALWVREQLQERARELNDTVPVEDVAELQKALKTVNRTLDAIVRATPTIERLVGELDEADVAFEATEEIGALEIVADELLLSIKRLDARAVALRRVARDLPSRFRVVNVENIGYKRTKRAEMERPNDLFSALDSTGKRLLDLELSSDVHELKVQPNASDILSVLRSDSLWA